MRDKSTVLVPVIVVGLLFAAAVQIAQAQKTANDNSRATQSDSRCHYVTITGAVLAPGHFELRRRVRLWELLSLVGGFNGFEEGTIRVAHAASPADCGTSTQLDSGAVSGKIETYDIAEILQDEKQKLNPYLQPGDVITVVETKPIYFVGGIRHPKVIPLRKHYTVASALDLAGDLLPGIKKNRVRIYRSTPGSATPNIIIVDLKAVWSGRQKDMALQPYDVIEVPFKKSHPGPIINIKPDRAEANDKQLPVRVIY